jgi:hypothetical protein
MGLINTCTLQDKTVRSPDHTAQGDLGKTHVLEALSQSVTTRDIPNIRNTISAYLEIHTIAYHSK